MIKYGIYTPNFGLETNARRLAELAHEAEVAGWDGFFIWDHILYSKSQKFPVVDPWVALAVIAIQTERIRIGTTVTPIARRRPWKLAQETVTLDHLSNGRLTLTVGLGDPVNADFMPFGDESDPKIRAALLDEGLDILAGLWRGKSFKYRGEHYQIERTTFLPAALQSPRIPIWVGGFWPNKRPFRRAARWDGAFPLMGRGTVKADVLQEIKTYIYNNRTTDNPFEMVVMGRAVNDDPAKSRRIIKPYVDAGLDWWLESLFGERHSHEAMLARIRMGPPQIDR